MTNEELEIRFERLVKTERKITLEILHLIREAERRRHFLERGFGSIYDWLIRGHGYSQSAANRRIQSSRLLEIPDAGEKIISGAVNITTLTQLQTVIRHEERRTGETIPAERKETLVNQISGKSAQEVERILKPIFPEIPKKEVMKITSADNARLSINLDREGWEALERVRELLSHAVPSGTWSEIVGYLAQEYRKRKDPLLKKFAAVNHRVKKRAGGRCEYRDEKSGRVCGSRHFVEVDHIITRFEGGIDEIENLRCLCRAHNLLEARRRLGAGMIGPYS